MRLFGRTNDLRRLTHEVRALRTDVESARTAVRATAETGIPVGLWVTTAVMAALCLLLLAHALRPAPIIGDPGRIGVALVAGGPTTSVSVDTAYEASTPNVTRFTLVITSVPQRRESQPAQPTFGFLFCGAIAEGLRVTEVNNQQLSPLRRVTTSAVEEDTHLGARSACKLITAHPTGFQLILQGVSQHPLASVSGKRAAYAFAGVRTVVGGGVIGAAERVNDVTLLPLPDDSAVSTSLQALPNDAVIDVAAPQLPGGGVPLWSGTLADGDDTSAPAYRLLTSRTNADNASQAALFFAGIAAGLAGGTFTAALPPTLRSIQRRTRSTTSGR